MANKKMRAAPRKSAKNPPQRKAVPSTKPRSKLDDLTAMLRSPKGTTIEAMMNATGWQSHSVRGALAGALKKNRGLVIRSEPTDGGRVYRADA